MTSCVAQGAERIVGNSGEIAVGVPLAEVAGGRVEAVGEITAGVTDVGVVPITDAPVVGMFDVVSPADDVVPNGPVAVENGVAEDMGKPPDGTVVFASNGTPVVVTKGVPGVVALAPVPVVTEPAPEEKPALFVLSLPLPPPQAASNPQNKLAAVLQINGDIAITLIKRNVTP